MPDIIDDISPSPKATIRRWSTAIGNGALGAAAVSTIATNPDVIPQGHGAQAWIPVILAVLGLVGRFLPLFLRKG